MEPVVHFARIVESGYSCGNFYHPGVRDDDDFLEEHFSPERRILGDLFQAVPVDEEEWNILKPEMDRELELPKLAETPPRLPSTSSSTISVCDGKVVTMEEIPQQHQPTLLAGYSMDEETLWPSDFFSLTPTFNQPYLISHPRRPSSVFHPNIVESYPIPNDGSPALENQSPGNNPTWNRSSGEISTCDQSPGNDSIWNHSPAINSTWNQSPGNDSTWNQSPGNDSTWYQSSGNNSTWNHLQKISEMENTPPGDQTVRKCRQKDKVFNQSSPSRSAKPLPSLPGTTIYSPSSSQSTSFPRSPSSSSSSSSSCHFSSLPLKWQQRQAANVRERKRMKTMNAAFDGLRSRIPLTSGTKKPTKVDILRLAIHYIRQLTNFIHNYDVIDCETPPEVNSKLTDLPGILFNAQPNLDQRMVQGQVDQGHEVSRGHAVRPAEQSA